MQTCKEIERQSSKYLYFCGKNTLTVNHAKGVTRFFDKVGVLPVNRLHLVSLQVGVSFAKVPISKEPSIC